VLVATVDGRDVLRRDLPDKDGQDTHYGREYDEDFVIDLPEGRHDVRIDNPGADWFSVDTYVFRGLR
jgi:hypothetical protein